MPPDYASTPGLVFDPERHSYALGPRELVPCTTVVKASTVACSYEGVPPEVMEVARARGVATHAAVEYWLQGVLDPDSVDPLIAGHLAGATECLTLCGFEPHAIELRLASRRYGFAGSPDLVGTLAGALRVRRRVRALNDHKTCCALDRVGAELQTAGYVILWEENFPRAPIHERTALWLREKRWRLKTLDHPDARTMFLYALELHNRPDGPHAARYRLALQSFAASVRRHH